MLLPIDEDGTARQKQAHLVLLRRILTTEPLNESYHQPAHRDRRPRLHRHNGRGLRILHGGRVGAPPCGRGELERVLVPAVGVCCDQLHREPGLRRIRGGRLVARRVHFDNLAAPRPRTGDTAPRPALRLAMAQSNVYLGFCALPVGCPVPPSGSGM
jgi:hypothetical protein